MNTNPGSGSRSSGLSAVHPPAPLTDKWVEEESKDLRYGEKKKIRHSLYDQYDGEHRGQGQFHSVFLQPYLLISIGILLSNHFQTKLINMNTRKTHLIILSDSPQGSSVQPLVEIVAHVLRSVPLVPQVKLGANSTTTLVGGAYLPLARGANGRRVNRSPQLLPSSVFSRYLSK